jgi:hypothetical protein
MFSRGNRALDYKDLIKTGTNRRAAVSGGNAKYLC